MANQMIVEKKKGLMHRATDAVSLFFGRLGQRWHYARLMRRIRAYPKSRKIRVGFWVDNTSKWKAQSLYEVLAKSEDFEPVILLSACCSDVKNWGAKIGEKLEKDEAFYVRLGDRCERAFDVKTMTARPLCEFHADIVFYQEPIGFFMEQVVWKTMKDSICCYLPYSVKMLGEHREYQNLSWFHQLMYAYFALNEKDAAFEREGRVWWRRAGRVVGLGHTIFDQYEKDGRLDWTLEKVKEGFIIYAPHFSFPCDEPRLITLSSFLENGRQILEYALAHPEQKWVFKPHPRLRFELVNKGVWTKEEVDAYYGEWEKIGAGYYSGDYIGLFRQARAMVTDCGSFCAEFPVTGKPLIRLIPQAYDFPVRPAFQAMMESFYVVHNLDEMYATFAQVLERGEDPKKECRLQAMRELGVVPSHAAERIADFLAKECGRR